MTTEDLIRHLGRLRRALGTPLVVVLDNLRQHKTKKLRRWCEKVGDVHLEPLPPYAPELNPIESAWSHGKYVTAAGRVVDTSAELTSLAQEAINAASEQRLLRGFIRSTGLSIQFDLPTRNSHS
jgi:putative transposase